MHFRKFLFISFLFLSVNVHLPAQRDTIVAVIDSAYSFGPYHCPSVYYYRTNGKWGTLDEKKKPVLPAVFDTLIFLKLPTSTGIFVGFIAQKNKKYGFVGENEKLNEKFVYDTIHSPYANGFNHYFVARKNGKYGITSYAGKIVVPFAYDYQSSMSGEGSTPFHIMVNQQGVYVANSLKQLYLCFRVNDSLEAWGFDRRMGIILQRSKNDSLFPVNGSWSDDGNFYTAYYGNDTTFRQHSGEGITLPIWAKYVTISDDQKYYIVQTNSNHFGIANKRLHLVTDTIYRNYCPSFQEMPDRKTRFYFMQKAVPGKTMYDFEGDWVMTNSKGKQINDLTFYKPYAFVSTLDFYGGATYVCNGDGKWGQMNQQLKWIVEPRYDSIWCLQWDTLNDRTSLLVKENGKYGILDSGKIIVPANYTHAIYAFGGYFVILENEKERVVYDPFSHALMNFDSLLLSQSLMFARYHFYSLYSYYNTGLPLSTQTKIIHSAYLMQRIAYNERLTNGEIFSPQLYSPDIYMYNYYCTEDEEKYAYPFYQPKRTYIPWFHFLSSCADSDFFSYAFNYNMIDSKLDVFNPNIYQRVYYNTSIIHYAFAQQDSITYANYSIRGDTCYPITLDSIFRKDISYEQELKRMFLNEIKKDKIQLPKGDWLIYEDHFYLTEKGMSILFRCSEKDKKGNTQIYGMDYTWETVSSLLDPKGPLRNKIGVKPKHPLRK